MNEKWITLKLYVQDMIDYYSSEPESSGYYFFKSFKNAMESIEQGERM